MDLSREAGYGIPREYKYCDVVIPETRERGEREKRKREREGSEI